MYPSDSPTPPAGQNGQPATDNLSERVQADREAVVDTAKRDLNDIAQQARSDVQELQRQAGEQVATATSRAKSFASDQKDFVAGQISGVAQAVSRVAGELDQSEQGTIARYARDLAGGLERLGREVEGNDVDGLMNKAQSFGRQQPLAFLGAAALGGFVASRFAMASAQRSQRGANQSPADGQPMNRPGNGGEL
ncbi:MAG TPA: nutrient deprivation-induced protein [Devosia sp.]|nr:nutrient deprivation-induced protein [Devosia sp.]